MINRTLSDILESLSGQRVLFVRPGGNWGDQLIYSGALALAREHSIECINLDHDEFLAATGDFSCPVYLHGSGGLNPWTSGRAIHILYHAVEHYRGLVIQGPQTISDDPDFVAEFASTLAKKNQTQEVLFFSRETKSHDIAKTAFAGTPIECLLDHDTAFHNRKEDLLTRGGLTQKYVLFALRQDNERTGREAIFSEGEAAKSAVVLDPAIYALSFDHWIRIHAASRSITTNRTHSAILGAILDIPTTLFASSSHKNHSVWKHSLATRRVTWSKTEQPNPPSPHENPRKPEDMEQSTRMRGHRIYDPRILLKPFYQYVNLPRMRAELSSRTQAIARRARYTCKGVPLR